MSSRDKQLLNGLRNRDKNAIAQVFEEYFKPCAKVVLKDGGTVDDAREVFHQVIYSLIKKLETPDFTIKSNLKGYLYQSCFNQWVGTKRERRKYDSIDNDKLSTIPDESLDVIAEKQKQEELYEAMQECIKQLNPKCQQGLELFFYKKKSDKEIAEIMSFSVKYVKQHRRRCIGELKQCMGA